MPIAALMPVGIIETHDQDNSFTFLRLPVDHEKLTLDSSVVVWNYKDENLARCRGIVTELTDEGGSVRITDTDVAAQWPTGLDPFGYANPVYLAGEPEKVHNDVYQPLQNGEMLVPDDNRMKLLQELAKEHENLSGIGPAHGIMTPVRALLQDGFHEEEHA